MPACWRWCLPLWPRNELRFALRIRILYTYVSSNADFIPSYHCTYLHIKISKLDLKVQHIKLFRKAIVLKVHILKNRLYCFLAFTFNFRLWILKIPWLCYSPIVRILNLYEFLWLIRSCWQQVQKEFWVFTNLMAISVTIRNSFFVEGCSEQLK